MWRKLLSPSRPSCSVHCQVLILDHPQKFDKPFVVVSPDFWSISKVTCPCVHCVQIRHNARSRPRVLSQKTLHFDFFHQIIRALMQVTKTIDLSSRSWVVDVIRSSFSGFWAKA
jgi:hypothetical protein